MDNEKDFTALNRSLRNYYRSISRTRWLIVFTELSLRAFGLKKTEKLLRLFSKKTAPPDPEPEGVILDRYATILNEIKRQTFLKGRCLSQSLVMRLLLGRLGIKSQLVIGARISNGMFNAHAWLEKNGAVLNDHPSVISEYPVFSASKLNSVLKFK